MFFTGNWNRKRFAVGIAIVIIAFVALSAAFPFALFAYAAASKCSGVSGACGVVGLIFSMMAKPAIYLLFFLGLIPPLIGRMRDIGVTPWLSLFVLLLVAADSSFLLYIGAPWSFAFSAGALRIEPPIFLFAALVLMVVLAIVPPRDGRIALPALGWPVWVLLATAMLVAVAATYRLMWSVPSLLALIVPVAGRLRSVITAGSYALIALPFVAAFALWPRRGQVLSAPGRSGPRLPIVSLGLIAIALASVLTLTLAPSGMGLTWAMMLPAAVVPYVLPNAVLFFLILLAIYLWVKRPSWIAALISVAVVVIYGTWGYQHYLAANSRAIDARDIAAIPVARPVSIPRAIFIDAAADGDRVALMHLALERSDIDMIVTKEKSQLMGYRYVAVDTLRPDPKTGFSHPIERYSVPAMPNPRLVIKSRSSSQFYNRAYGGQYEGDSPYELHIVDGDTDLLIAVWYRRIIQAPTWFPILTTNGWRTSGPSGKHVDRDVAGRQFLIDALGAAPLVPEPKPAAWRVAVHDGAKVARGSLKFRLPVPKHRQVRPIDDNGLHGVSARLRTPCPNARLSTWEGRHG